MSESRSSVISLRFNQDHSCFTCGMDTGFRVYNVDPLAEKLRLTHIPVTACTSADGSENKPRKDKTPIGSIHFVEMLHRSNLLAIVAGGQRAKFAENTVLIWDDNLKKFCLELTFTLPVLSVKMRRDRLIVATINQIHVFTFPNRADKLQTFDTRDNPKGLVEVCPSSERALVIFPAASKEGSVQIVHIGSMEASVSISPVTVNAHQSEIACLAINQTGSLMATASVKGTLIRVFDIDRRCLLLELRRGMDTANIHCITISNDSAYLCCSSDKGTVHIFALKETKFNRRSLLSQMGKVGFLNQSMENQLDLASFTVPAECACLCAFSSNSSVIAVCLDGSFHRYVFTTTGSCNRESFDIYLALADNVNF